MFYDHNTYQSALAGAPVNNFLGAKFTACMPCQMANSTFGLGKNARALPNSVSYYTLNRNRPVPQFSSSTSSGAKPLG